MALKELKTVTVKVGEQDVVYAMVKDGMPVYVDDDGKEVPGDLLEAINNLKATSDEREALSKQLNSTKKKLEPWEALQQDPVKVKESLETLARVSKGELVNADQLAAATKEIVQKKDEEHQKELEAVAKKAAAAEEKALAVGRRALLSELVNEKKDDKKTPVYAMGLPTAEAVYGRHFVPDDKGGWIAYWDPESKVDIVKSEDPSRASLPAKPSEAFRIMVERNPDKAFHLWGVGATGSGVSPSGGPLGANVITRDQFEKLPHPARADFFAKGGQIAADS